MFANKRCLQNQGFTIVETLIVLAVAGLILLMIFIIVPTLQRASRNNQRKQDIQTILGAISRYELNDSGNFPMACGPPISRPDCTAASGLTTAPNDYFLRYSQSKLKYYDSVNISLSGLSRTAPTASPNQVTDLAHIYIYNYQKCSSTAAGTSTSTGAGYNDVVALFGIEAGSGGGISGQCQQL